ncbi:MAG: cytochrome c biogenesis protein ResB [Flaviflexus sp.]|nr:cytochrome c biogenesis protein ResB [Flaviflexus sp.]
MKRRARWAWRQLTSMRLAIILLLILIVAIIPASMLPQQRDDPAAVAAWVTEHGTWGEIVSAIGLLDVLRAPWFAAIYLLLFISLLGCIIPRTGQWVRRLRSRPGRIPTRLDRFDGYVEAASEAGEEEVARKVARALPRYRSEKVPGGVSLENGYLREGANLLFHICLFAILIVFALSQALTYRGQAIVVEGESFVNSSLAYDSFTSGTLVGEAKIEPFRLRLDDMEAKFDDEGNASHFSAEITVTEPNGEPRTEELALNNPVRVSGTDIFLSGNGYAPHLIVTDEDGAVAFDGHVVLADVAPDYISRGVAKIPDTTNRERQLGLQLTLYPTAVWMGESLISVYPGPVNPYLVALTWIGDLGLDDGRPQNVYDLDTTKLELQTDSGGLATMTVLEKGHTATLPGGATLTFAGLDRFAALDFNHAPLTGLLGFFAVLGFASITASLLLPQRRIWVRVSEGRISAAGIGRSHDDRVGADVRRAIGSIVDIEEAL